jgi:hypothetical protein
MGREVHWFSVVPIEGAEKGTDRWAVEQGWVSLTPLRLDLTDEAKLAESHATRPLDEATALEISPERSSPAAEQSIRDEEATGVTGSAAVLPEADAD